MKRYEPFDEAVTEKIKQEVNAALEPIAEKFGVCLEQLKAVCDSGSETMGINLKFTLPPREESVASRKEENDYRAYAEGFGMRAEWLGKEFQRGHFTYKVVGLQVAAPDHCAILQRSDGSRCQENGKLVARYLGA